MSFVLQHLGDALRLSFAMFWQVLWPLSLGFLLSAVVESLVSKKTVRSGVSARMSALETPAAGREEAVETRISWRPALGACAAVAPQDRTGDKECET